MKQMIALVCAAVLWMTGCSQQDQSAAAAESVDVQTDQTPQEEEQQTQVEQAQPEGSVYFAEAGELSSD